MTLRVDVSNRVLAIAAVALLFVMPVSARAGIREPHPHALLQLALDEDDGRLDHHLATGGSSKPSGHDHRRGHVDPFSLGPTAHDNTRAGGAARTVAEKDFLAINGGPAWSAPSAGLVWAFLTILGAVWVGAIARRSEATLVLADPILPDGRSRRPDLPPPRLWASSLAG
jgi:hypothetical protein